MSSDDEERWVCADCVGESFLSAAIRDEADEHVCSFCDESGPTIAVEDLADRVEAAFETHFYRTSDQPDGFESAMLRDKELEYEWDRSGEEVVWAIAGAADVSEEIAQEVLEILGDRHSDFDSAAMGEECEFDPESYYERKGPNDIEFQLEWKSLERSLKTETRFFNKEAEALLDRIFRDIEHYKSREGHAVIRDAGPATALPHFFRARVFHSDRRLAPALERPDRELGPPPSAIAPGGRMNAPGVSLFYGATDPSAALAEVRPPVGSRTLLGRFDIIRPLRLLDIEALRSVYIEGSIFDSAYMTRLELAKFLTSLSHRITMPVMPDDEVSDYLITQAIADYVAASTALNLDGMLYPSVQKAGAHQNVVLFRRASRVDELELPDGAEVAAILDRYDDEGVSPDYWVSEKVPPAAVDEVEEEENFGILTFSRHTYLDPFAEPGDDREPALKVAVDTIQVHHVEAISIKTQAYDVTRHRSEIRPSKFSKIEADPDF